MPSCCPHSKQLVNDVSDMFLKQKESLKYFAEKEALAAQVTSLQHELATCQKSALETTARLKQEVNSKLYQLKDAMEANKRLQPELDRLRVQVRTLDIIMRY